MTNMEHALRQAGVKLPLMHRAWLMVKDHPGTTSPRIAQLLKAKEADVSSTMSQLRRRKMVDFKMETVKGRMGIGIGTREVYTYSVPARMKEYELLPLVVPKAERLAAARVFMGVGAITTLYAGLRSAQFYMLAMAGYGLYEFVKSLGDDDEEQEVEQGYLNPETFDREFMKYADEQGRELSKKDMDYYIRTAWIPETFGEGGPMQEALGISGENAAKLATAADIGIPGVFGVDISNSLALTGLWHPVDTKADNPEAAFYEGLGRTLLGPSASLSAAPIKFFTEANAGNFDKAIEAVMPAFLRGYVKAERLQDEGLVVGKNRDIILRDPSFYDTSTLMMQSLGFAEAETSRAMQLDIRAGEIEREIAGEQTALLDQRYRAVLSLVNDPSEEAERSLRGVERAIEIYNLNYPSNAITQDTKERSFEQKAREAAARCTRPAAAPSRSLSARQSATVWTAMRIRYAWAFSAGQSAGGSSSAASCLPRSMVSRMRSSSMSMASSKDALRLVTITAPVSFVCVHSRIVLLRCNVSSLHGTTQFLTGLSVGILCRLHNGPQLRQAAHRMVAPSTPRTLSSQCTTNPLVWS